MCICINTFIQCILKGNPIDSNDNRLTNQNSVRHAIQIQRNLDIIWAISFMSSLSCLARVTLLSQNKLNQLYLVCMLGSSTPEYKDFQTSSNSYLFMGHDSTFLVFWVYQIVFFSWYLIYMYLSLIYLTINKLGKKPRHSVTQVTLKNTVTLGNRKNTENCAK